MKYILKSITFILSIFLFATVVNAKKYNTLDFVYYNPVDGSICNQDNYWTKYDKDTNCFRFAVVTMDDTDDKTEITLLLDHNLDSTVFADYPSVLKKAEEEWKDYNKELDLLDEDTVSKLMNLTEKPYLENGKAVSKNGGTSISRLRTNTRDCINSKYENSAGYWLKTSFETNNDYAYTITEYANNSVIPKKSKRGVRPIITVSKDKLTDMKDNIDISDKIAFKYEYFNEKNYLSPSDNKNHTYKQLQGFTITPNNIFFYGSNNSTPEDGVLMVYGGDNYSKQIIEPTLGKTGHGNDMTYNPKTNEVLLVGPNSYKDIFVYDADTAEYKNKVTLKDFTSAGIAYDELHDYYIFTASNNALITDNEFNPLYSYPLVRLETGQGIEYNNGYLYVPTFEVGTCPNTYQIYCFGEKSSAVIYVYDNRMDEEGNPVKSFGRLVDILYINGSIGEIESVSFLNGNMYFGFSLKEQENVSKHFGFYNMPYETVKYNPKINIEYDDNFIKVTSDVKLQVLEGWTPTNDGYSLIKEINNGNKFSENICDMYGNCITKEFTPEYIDPDPIKKDPILPINPPTGYFTKGIFTLLILLILILKFNKRKIYKI